MVSCCHAFGQDVPAATLGESEDRTDQEYNRLYHVRVHSRFVCEWQCRILLNSQADGILANHRGSLSKGDFLLRTKYIEAANAILFVIRC
jgi:hypothetical protein